MRDLLDDLGHGVTHPTPLYLDSKSALDLAADPVAFKKTKHILCHAYDTSLCLVWFVTLSHRCRTRQACGRND